MFPFTLMTGRWAWNKHLAMVRRIQCERMGSFAKEVIEGLTTSMCYEGGISEHPLPSTDLSDPRFSREAYLG